MAVLWGGKRQLPGEKGAKGPLGNAHPLLGRQADFTRKVVQVRHKLLENELLPVALEGVSAASGVDKSITVG